MKAAFLFSGQLRGFEHCIEPFKQYLFSAFAEYDTFFYLPTVDGKKLYSLWEPTAALLEIDQVHKDIPNFTQSIGRSDHRCTGNNYPALPHLQHYYLQWYGVKRVFEIFECFKTLNNIQYDVVFRIRPDIKFFEKFNYEFFDGIQTSDKAGHGGYYDRLAYGSFEHMKHYCSLYDHLYQGKYNEPVYSNNSESKLRQHIESKNIAWNPKPLQYYQSVNIDGTCWM